jgi:hypothetical protein
MGMGGLGRSMGTDRAGHAGTGYDEMSKNESDIEF